MLEPPHFFALAIGMVAVDFVGAAVAQMQQDIHRMQAHAGHQDCGHGHDQERCAIGQTHVQHGALVFAEQLLHALESDGINVPGVAGNIGHVLQGAISRGMKAVVHAGGQAQGDERTAFENAGPRGTGRRTPEQAVQGIGKAFCLINLSVLNAAAGANDGITGGGERVWGGVNRTDAGFEFPDKTSVQGVKVCFTGFAQVQVAEKFPDGYGQFRDPWVANLAPPAHQPGQGDARDAVGEQEIQVLLLQKLLKLLFQIHDFVTQFS